MTRVMLYEAAQSMLRSKKWSWPLTPKTATSAIRKRHLIVALRFMLASN
jgi:hypothetical protein